jgi:hypothetical protein
MDQIGGGGQGKIAFDRAWPSVTQKQLLVSHFPTARWVALGHENESTGLPESSKRHWKNESWYRRKKKAGAALKRMRDNDEPHFGGALFSHGGDRSVHRLTQGIK